MKIKVEKLRQIVKEELEFVRNMKSLTMITEEKKVFKPNAITSLLVQSSLKTIRKKSDILDLGCGTGYVGLTIAKNTKIGSYSICNGCRMPINNKEKKSPKYKIGLSCPKCYDNLTKDQIERFTIRHQQIINSKNNYKFRRNIVR